MQVYVFFEMKEKVKGMGYDVVDYDGCFILYFKSFDDVQNFFLLKDYVSFGEDCKYFMDLSKGVKVMVG